MRLTALAGSPVALELYILADQRAQIDSLDTEFCDVFRFAGAGSPELSPCFEGESTEVVIGHPQIKSLFWQDCCLTRLRGSLEPDQMDRDMYVQWQTPSARHARYFSPDGARGTAATAAIVLWTTGLPILLFVRQKHAPADLRQRRRFFLTKAFRPVLIGCLLLYVAVYAMLPQVEAEAVPFDSRFFSTASLLYSHEEPLCVFALESEGSLDRYRRLLADYCRYNALSNSETFGPLIEEDSPGNYQVEAYADGFRITLYDDQMRKTTRDIPADPTKYPGEDLEIRGNPFDPKVYQERRAAALADAQAFVQAPSRAAWERLLRQEDRFFSRDFARTQEIIQLGRQHPEKVVPLLVHDIRHALVAEDNSYDAWILASLLGNIIQVPPPLDVTSTAAMGPFLKRAEESATRSSDQEQPGTAAR